MEYQIQHYAVACSDQFGYRTDVAADKFIAVVRPNVCSVSKTGKLQKIRKRFGLCFNNNLLNEVGTHFRKSERTDFCSDLLRSDPERACRQEQIHNAFVAHRNVVDADTGILFKPAVLGRNIMAKLVEFKYGVVQVRECKVSRDDSGTYVVRRMLDWSEIVYVIFTRNDDYTAGMLSRCRLGTDYTEARFYAKYENGGADVLPDAAYNANVGHFSDLPSGEEFRRAIVWADWMAIANGYSDGTFRPMNICNRAQAMTFLWRYDRTAGMAG